MVSGCGGAEMSDGGEKVIQIRPPAHNDEQNAEYFSVENTLKRALENDFESVVLIGVKKDKVTIGWSKIPEYFKLIAYIQTALSDLLDDWR